MVKIQLLRNEKGLEYILELNYCELLFIFVLELLNIIIVDIHHYYSASLAFSYFA